MSLRSNTLRISAAASVALLAACGDPDEVAPATEPAERSDAIAIDWTQLPTEPIEVDGWSFKDCGDVYWPSICATHAELGAGRIQSEQYALATLPDFKAELDANGPEAALRWLAESTVRMVTEDRPIGCPGASVSHAEYEAGSVDSHPAMRFDIEVSRGELVVEHVRVYNVFDGENVFSIAATGVDPESGCFPREWLFDVPGVEDFLPIFDRIMAGSTNLRGLGWNAPPPQG